MIFVTVGTHEQQFNRLVKTVDDLKKRAVITERVIMQTGYSDYQPEQCEYRTFFPYRKMQQYVDEARIVITHGGPSSFMMPLHVGKIPIVVPRQAKFKEHVNNHQVDFCQAVAREQGNILVILEINQLSEVVNHYDLFTETMPADRKSNNAGFCKQLEKIVREIL